jgi:CxxC-x17-CxxC domain-containing protein
MEHHRDEHITCAECGTTFVFSAAEADSFASKNLEPPKRCAECRRARRQQRNGAPREHAPRGQFGGDVNGYRAPMSDPGASRGGRDGEYRAPGFRDSQPAYGQRGGYRGGNQAGHGEYRAPSFGGDQGPRGGGEYRAPSFGGDRGGPPRGGFRGGPGGPGGAGGGFRRGPQRGGDRGFARGPRGPQDQQARGNGGNDRAPREGNYDRGPREGGHDRAPHAHGPRHGHDRAQHAGGHDRAPRAPRPEKPSYPITCAQCGAASEVPFKPQEGREILCRDCYRAKKDAAG